MSPTPLSHVLLDIEGTTCPVSFVSEVLFPYAAEHLGSFLEAHADEEETRQLLRQVEEAWAVDRDPEAIALREACQHPLSYLLLLIRQDRKLSPLKELQGLVWEQGYRSGRLLGPLFEDVPVALQRWHEAGLGLAVYSSGSVKAQQLLYAFSTAGDLRHLFQHWFDTRIGSKLEADSYRKIVASLGTNSSEVLFISDSIAELQAASSAGLCVLLSNRAAPSPTTQAPPSFPAVTTFSDLTI